MLETLCVPGSNREGKRDGDDAETLFGNESARQTFKVPRKFKAVPGEECAIVTLV